jgi:uncharacterized protein YidB (DUF937 family)
MLQLTKGSYVADISFLSVLCCGVVGMLVAALKRVEQGGVAHIFEVLEAARAKECLSCWGSSEASHTTNFEQLLSRYVFGCVYGYIHTYIYLRG